MNVKNNQAYLGPTHMKKRFWVWTKMADASLGFLRTAIKQNYDKIIRDNKDSKDYLHGFIQCLWAIRK